MTRYRAGLDRYLSEAIKVAKEINPSDVWMEVELWGGNFDEKQDAELERKHNQ